MPFPIGAVITAAGTIGATAANAGMTGKTNRKSRNFIRDQWLAQRDLDRENWNMQNEYNLPENQMKRLKDAGLNPALVYGSGATTAAAEVDSHQAASWNPEAPQIDPNVAGKTIGNFYEAKVMKTQESILQQNLKNLKAEEHAISAKTMESLAHAKAADQGTERSKFDLALDQELRNYTSSKRKSETHTASAIVDQMQIKTKADQNTLDNQKTKQKLENAYMKMSTLEKAQAINKMEQEIRNMGEEEKLKKYENRLHENAIQKTDPWYYRLLINIISGENFGHN